MGIFSRLSMGKASGGKYPYEVPMYLSGKEIAKREKEMFSGIHAADRTSWLLNFAAPMLAKDGQYADCFPHYKGKKYEKMEKAFQENWGKANEGTVEEQLGGMLMGACTTLLDPLYDMTREFSPEQWEAQIHRISHFSERQTAKISEMKNVYSRIQTYEFPLPESTLLAYDLCRASNLICIAVGLEALRPNNASYYLEQVAWTANQFYSSWEEYYSAYAIGRAFWLWKMEQFMAMGSTIDCNLCRILLKSPQSSCGRLELSFGMEECEAPSNYYGSGE